MYSFITMLIVIICVLIVVVVLVQNPKGGGLGAGFGGGGGGSNAFGGVQKTADFLERMTWGLAIGLLVLSLVSNAFLPNRVSTIDNQGVEDVELFDRLNE